MSVTDSILKTIEFAIDRKIKPYTNMDIAGIIVGIPDDTNDAYQVRIDKAEYKIVNGTGIGFKAGDLVWVHCPNGDFNKKYIISSRSSYSKFFRNTSNNQQGGGSSGITEDDIITNEEIDAMFS